MFYVYSSPIWIELCMFLFYQAIAPFSKEMVLMSHNCFVYLDDGIFGQQS